MNGFLKERVILVPLPSFFFSSFLFSECATFPLFSLFAAMQKGAGLHAVLLLSPLFLPPLFFFFLIPAARFFPFFFLFPPSFLPRCLELSADLQISKDFFFFF